MSKTGNKLVGCCGRKWQFIYNSHCIFFLVEADKEVKEKESSRGLSDEEKKERPSEIMNALEKGFSALANIVTDEVDK